MNELGGKGKVNCNPCKIMAKIKKPPSRLHEREAIPKTDLSMHLKTVPG